MKRIYLAVGITEEVSKLVSKSGRFIAIENTDSKPISVEYRGYQILYSTPFTKLPGLDG